jgi:hypothetical protein
VSRIIIFRIIAYIHFLNIHHICWEEDVHSSAACGITFEPEQITGKTV